ncbi:hypothetical protein [Sphingomonas sp. BK580]|jgi:hypothetical protein|uniref:hypothetical protein n=1 Tax=Sphingomonas sp. BK580 TaxID=2586972 RepID=UPI00161F65FF|nr:hypothetical protein [Sphingomonas sp. BK580]MBB3695000.1 hypothetical protein [Sphingomonas sp. BK580]
MKALLIISSLSATALAADGPVGPQAEIVYHTAFYKGDDPSFEDLPIIRSISHSTMAALPRTTGTYVMISVHCTALRPSGQLSGCKTEVEPNNTDWRRVAGMMARDIRAEPGFAKRVAGNISFIDIYVRASNSDTVALSGPCWPPTCNIVPAPPPPPPPPRPN